jgi:NTP pyrophosphatase (non-canonical NTP hydrolase)
MKRPDIVVAILQERKRQDQLHPEFQDSKRLAVLVEEVGEIAEAIQNRDMKNLEEELIQVAAVCVRWLEQIKGVDN